MKIKFNRRKKALPDVQRRKHIRESEEYAPDNVLLKKLTAGAGKWKPGNPAALARCRYQARGNFKAGCLLYHIQWRYKPILKGDEGGIFRLGHKWIVASAAFWAREAGLTEKEYNLAISLLKEFQLIEVKTWKFKRVRAVWIRLCPENYLSFSSAEYEDYEQRRQIHFHMLVPDWDTKNYHRKLPGMRRRMKNIDPDL